MNKDKENSVNPIEVWKRGERVKEKGQYTREVKLDNGSKYRYTSKLKNVNKLNSLLKMGIIMRILFSYMVFSKATTTKPQGNLK